MQDLWTRRRLLARLPGWVGFLLMSSPFWDPLKEAKGENRPATLGPPVTAEQRKDGRLILSRRKEIGFVHPSKDHAVIEEMLDEMARSLLEVSDPAEAWNRLFRSEDMVGIKVNGPLTGTVGPLISRLRSHVGIPEKNFLIFDRDRYGIGPNEIDEPSRKRPVPFGKDGVNQLIDAPCTALINVAYGRFHYLAGVTGCLKNWLGILARVSPSLYHRGHCLLAGRIAAEPVVRLKTRLNIMDLLGLSFHAGPITNRRYVMPYKGILMGKDPVAMDRVLTELIQAQRTRYRGKPWPIDPKPVHVAYASRHYGLGRTDLDHIQVLLQGDMEALLKQ